MRRAGGMRHLHQLPAQPAGKPSSSGGDDSVKNDTLPPKDIRSMSSTRLQHALRADDPQIWEIRGRKIGKCKGIGGQVNRGWRMSTGEGKGGELVWSIPASHAVPGALSR